MGDLAQYEKILDNLAFGNKYLLMKALTIITITIASATILLAGEEGYYVQLQSMLSKGHLKVYPKDPDKDVSLVTIEKGLLVYISGPQYR